MNSIWYEVKLKHNIVCTSSRHKCLFVLKLLIRCCGDMYPNKQGKLDCIRQIVHYTIVFPFTRLQHPHAKNVKHRNTHHYVFDLKKSRCRKHSNTIQSTLMLSLRQHLIGFRARGMNSLVVHEKHKQEMHDFVAMTPLAGVQLVHKVNECIRSAGEWA